MSKKKHKIPKFHPSLHVIGAVVLFFLSVIVSKQAELLSWEKTLFLSIYNWPDFLRPLFIFVTWFGSVQVLAVFVLILTLFKKNNVVIRLLMTSTLAYLLAGLAKGLWGRTRPDELLHIMTRDYSYGPGFPSGHTALAVAMALVAGHYLPKKYHWVVVMWIVGVGISRIYLGVHAPLDIVGGFAIGWFSYMIFRHVRLYPVKFGKRPRKTKVDYNTKHEKNSKKRAA